MSCLIYPQQHTGHHPRQHPGQHRGLHAGHHPRHQPALHIIVPVFRTQNSELRILFDIIHVQLIETNSVGSLLL